MTALTNSERKYTSYASNGFQHTSPSEIVAGTCRWLLETSQYREWQRDESSAILWITGDAGCGKTTLTSFVAEALRTEAIQEKVTSSQPVVMKFFCAKDISAPNDGQSIVRGLLITILTSRRNVIRRVKAEFAPVKLEFGQSLEFLWNILIFALDVASCERYYVSVDVLDECQAQSREKLLKCNRDNVGLVQRKRAVPQ